MTTTSSTTTTTTTTTTQPPYTTDFDLLSRRPNLVSLGVSSWETMHEKAKELINRDLEAGWYRKASAEEGLSFRETSFAPSRMLNADTQLKDLSIFKVLELAYEYLAKDAKEDNYMKLRDRYHKSYKEELKSVTDLGIHYDWDADGVVEEDEKYSQTLSRRLQRA